MHQVGVDPEGDVVQEDARARAPDVDPQLAVGLERGERRDRIVPVEADVTGEMVPRAEGHADERHVALQGHLRDGAERAVASGDADRAARRAGDFLRIVARREHEDVYPAARRFAPEFFRVRLTLSGPRVHDQ